MLLCVFVTGERNESILFTKEKSDTCQNHRAGAVLSDALEPGGSRNLVHDAQRADPAGLLRYGRKLHGE